jgi:hypothetical protein
MEDAKSLSAGRDVNASTGFWKKINLPAAETEGYPEKARVRQPRGKTTGDALVHSMTAGKPAGC